MSETSNNNKEIPLLKELEQRWLIHQIANDDIAENFNLGGQSLYFGVDPSADSMQLGNFIALMNAFHFMKKWNKLYLLVWGATWMIGNPTWKDKERNFLSMEQLKINQEWIRKQFEEISQRLQKQLGKTMEFEIVNNYDFFKDMNVLDFLREVGKYITVNWMNSKEFVRSRIEDPDKSISYAEFSYMLLMWYDYYKLYTEKWVTLEVWWSDEWDGMITWLELVHKKTWNSVAAITNPLVKDSTWRKFWKSEWNAIWLDENKNSPYFVYQYLLNITDEDLEKLLKVLTFIELDEIQKIIDKHFQDPEIRYWQKILAEEVCKIIFWIDKTQTAQKITEITFGKQDKLEIIKSLWNEEIDAVIKEIWGIKIDKETNIIDLMAELDIVPSKSQWRKTIADWWIYFNEERVNSVDMNIWKNNLIDGKIWLIRRGKKVYKLIVMK